MHDAVIQALTSFWVGHLDQVAPEGCDEGVVQAIIEAVGYKFA
jgi:hypothetical protein